MENVLEVVPFLWVDDMERSLRFYVDGLGFEVRNRWTPEGKLRWCRLELGGSAMMLREFWRDGHHAGRPEGRLGQGMSLCFTCRDALAIYREAIGRGLTASEPEVGNRMWVTSLADPDGYALSFESHTD